MTGVVVVSNGCRGSGCGRSAKRTKREVNRQSQLSSIALLMAAIKKSMVHCKMNFGEEQDIISSIEKMEISWPTEVRHVAHVTFDRFNGFLGLPVEFEVEIPCPAPSASVSVFGVSSESMQCSYDSNGNSVPTILLLMQERLYSQGGLKAEGIFRITPENSEEKELRNQVNKGIIPNDIDVHCLAALIKAWFRELPVGILDSLSPGQVLQCETEDDCYNLIKLLPPTQFALLSWAVDLMADVVEEKELNKMNARNIAMVFAPNMTQLSDPLTSLMHAVQVMNLLQTLIFRTQREREDAALMEGYSLFSSSCSSEDCSYDDSGELRESNSNVFDKEDTSFSVNCNNCSYDASDELQENNSEEINEEDMSSAKNCSYDDSGESKENNSNDCNKEDMCCDVKEENSSNIRFSFYRNSIYEEDEPTEDIEECFLNQIDLDNAELEESSKQETRSTFESCISKSEVNQCSNLNRSMGFDSNLVDLQNEVSEVKFR